MADPRTWCRAQGFEVGDRGPLPPLARIAWQSALDLGIVTEDPKPVTWTDSEVVAAERCGIWMENRERFCRMGRVPNTDVCVIHGGAHLIEARAVGVLRQHIADTILPIAVERMKGILLDPDTKDENLIRASVAIMDRSGLGPVQGVVLSGEVTMAAPLDVLRQMLTSNEAHPLPSIEDAIIVSDSDDAGG